MSVVLTALYAPGDRPDRFDKAMSSGADVVILDLEDAVASARKDAARDAVATWLSKRGAAVGVPTIQVRVNRPGSEWFDADLAAVAAAAGHVAVRLPKVESVADLDAVADAGAAGLGVHALIETALGVERAYEIASHPAVRTIGLGEADLVSELGVTGDAGLAWCRSRVVVAARAAGLRPPLMSVYTDLSDETGLIESCYAGRTLGMVGRAAIHPRQLRPIVTAFRPSADEVEHARSAVDVLATAATDGSGVTVLPSGEMLDAAMLGHARDIIAREESASTALARTDRPSS